MYPLVINPQSPILFPDTQESPHFENVIVLFFCLQDAEKELRALLDRFLPLSYILGLLQSLCVCFQTRVWTHLSGWPWVYVILLSQTPKLWDYRFLAPYLTSKELLTITYISIDSAVIWRVSFYVLDNFVWHQAYMQSLNKMLLTSWNLVCRRSC